MSLRDIAGAIQKLADGMPKTMQGSQVRIITAEIRDLATRLDGIEKRLAALESSPQR